jgi:hypothetical protein
VTYPPIFEGSESNGAFQNYDLVKLVFHSHLSN